MFRVKSKLSAVLLATAALAATPPASAALVVDTGTPDGLGSNLSMSSIQSLAGYFTLGSAATIHSVEGYINGPAGSTATIRIYSDGLLPSAPNQLFSQTFTTVSTQSWQGVFGQNWNLAAGNYWVGFESTGFNGMRGFAPAPLAQYASAPFGSWRDAPGVALGVRIDATVASSSGVPEPTTWLTMILGFAAMGAAMRRRAKANVKFNFA